MDSLDWKWGRVKLWRSHHLPNAGRSPHAWNCCVARYVQSWVALLESSVYIPDQIINNGVSWEDQTVLLLIWNMIHLFCVLPIRCCKSILSCNLYIGLPLESYLCYFLFFWRQKAKGQRPTQKMNSWKATLIWVLCDIFRHSLEGIQRELL